MAPRECLSIPKRHPGKKRRGLEPCRGEGGADADHLGPDGQAAAGAEGAQALKLRLLNHEKMLCRLSFNRYYPCNLWPRFPVFTVINDWLFDGCLVIHPVNMLYVLGKFVGFWGKTGTHSPLERQSYGSVPLRFLSNFPLRGGGEYHARKE